MVALRRLDMERVLEEIKTMLAGLVEVSGNADGSVAEYGFTLKTNGAGVWSFETFSNDSMPCGGELRAVGLDGLGAALDGDTEGLLVDGGRYEAWPSLEAEVD